MIKGDESSSGIYMSDGTYLAVFLHAGTLICTREDRESQRSRSKKQAMFRARWKASDNTCMLAGYRWNQKLHSRSDWVCVELGGTACFGLQLPD